MIVVFDTNIWLTQLGLRSPAASGVRFFIRRNNYQVALPEVVRMEVEANLKSDLMEFISKIKDSHEQLLTVFGELPAVVLPTPDQVDKIIPELFTSVGVDVLRVPFSIESATSSFLKTIHKVAPSNNNQQFKDGVLWADCLSLLANDDVTLVTADKAFYAGHNYGNGLAKNLLAEANEYANKFRIVDSLPKLLETIPKDIPFNEEKLVDAMIEAAENDVKGYLAKGFELGESKKVTRSLFATEDTGKLFFECSIAIVCPDATGLGRSDALLTISADGLYSWETETFDNISLDGTTFDFNDENSERQLSRGIWFKTGSVVMGHRKVSNTVREKLTFD